MSNSTVLAIVIPVCNEQSTIVSLLRDWKPVFEKTGVPYCAILIDDGSKDDSLSILRYLSERDSSMEVVTQPNAGHGPAILRGYRMALEAEWVFQIDSDHQLEITGFSELWNNRDRYDLLLAERTDKNASAGRRVLSRVSGGIVRSFFGGAVRDVNSPYRLMRAELLGKSLQAIPPDSFAPNILITAWFVRQKSRIFRTTVTLRDYAGLRRSKMSGYILRGAIRSAVQTLIFRLRC
jgi:dolichol-phosphate mannosyltransferase